MSCPEFVASSLATRTAAHILHILSRSYAQHNALGDFYEALTDKVDAYAEVYLGLDNSLRTFPSVPTPRTDDPIELLEGYLAEVQEEQAEDHDSEALKNLLAEIEELTARTLYKLRRLK